MVMADSQTTRYPKVKEQFKSTNSHFLGHPETRGVQYAQAMNETYNSSLGNTYGTAMYTTFTPNPASSMAMAPTATLGDEEPAKPKHRAMGMSFKLFQTTLDKTAAKGPQSATAPLAFSRSARGFERPQLDINTVASSDLVYKSNGNFELGSKRLELPRSDSGKFHTTDLLDRKSEYAASYQDKVVYNQTLYKTGRQF